jgi:hypothetical protein
MSEPKAINLINMINNSHPPPHPRLTHPPRIQRGGEPMGFIIFIILIHSILYNIYTIYMIDKDLGGEEGLSLLSGRLSYLSHIYGDLWA